MDATKQVYYYPDLRDEAESISFYILDILYNTYIFFTMFFNRLIQLLYPTRVTLFSHCLLPKMLGKNGFSSDKY